MYFTTSSVCHKLGRDFTRYRRCISLSPCSSGRCAVSPTVLVSVESYSAGRRRRQAPCLAAQSISTRLEREVSARRRRQRRTQTVSHDSAPRTHVVTALRAGAPRTFRAAAAPRAPPPRRRPHERARALRRAPGAGPAATPEAPPPRLGRASVARGRSKPLAGKVGPPHGASAAPEQELRPRGLSARPTAALRSEQRCSEPVQGPSRPNAALLACLHSS